jgi:hypothetical protein
LWFPPPNPAPQKRKKKKEKTVGPPWKNSFIKFLCLTCGILEVEEWRYLSAAM